MKSSKRKTRSDKFPLTLHPTELYCKKIKGKIHYFGTDKKKHSKDTWLKRHIYTGAQSLIQKRIVVTIESTIYLQILN